VATLLDRSFFVRVIDGSFDPPRTAAQARSLRPVRGERWLEIQADTPADVTNHLRRVVAKECRLRPCACPVHVLYEASRRDKVFAGRA